MLIDNPASVPPARVAGETDRVDASLASAAGKRPAEHAAAAWHRSSPNTSSERRCAMIASERLTVPTHDALSADKAPIVPDSSASAALPSRSEWLSSKTRPRHLERQAVVYVRQSTPHQVVEHTESLARQYALRERAVVLGWPSPSVLMIDQDLGLSGSGCENRVGFQRLLAEVAQDRVGLVLALEISRLRATAATGTICSISAVRDVLLADEDGVYDSGDINDRLILGMKGIMSELELHIMKGRLERGRRNKAQRGELYHSVPWGYVLQPDGTVALDPDEQVRATVRRLFDTFQRLGTVYAVVRELRRDDVKLPTRDGNGLLSCARGYPVDRADGAAPSALRRRLRLGAPPDSHPRRSRRANNPPPPTPRAGRMVRAAPRPAPAYITWDQYLANQRHFLQNQRRPATKSAPAGGSAAPRRPGVLRPLRAQDVCQLSIDQARPLLLFANGAACANRRGVQRPAGLGC